MHCDETLDGRRYPSGTRAFRPCFRREAGAHGKDTRGLYRVHQFTKVEQVVFCAPDEAVAEKHHYELLGNAEAILAKLEIPYRVALACTGEIGLGQTRKHEIESWMPGRNAYSETHSCSTLGDFQTRRSNIRVRNADGSLGYPFTLNNTAIASPRILIPLLENHQNADGSVTLPEGARTVHAVEGEARRRVGMYRVRFHARGSTISRTFLLYRNMMEIGNIFTSR